MMEVNKIYQGDALAILKSFPDCYFDGVITDPPYSSGGAFRGDRMNTTSEKYQVTGTDKKYPDFSGDNRDQRSWTYWTMLWLSDCLRVSKPSAPICLFIDWRQLPSLTDAMQAAGWVWRGVAVWDKTEAARPNMGRFKQQAEFIVWGSNGPMPENKAIGCLPGVFKHIVRQDDKFHVTGKPTPLMRNIVKIVPEGGIILDPFAGSGTTLLAAKSMNRRYVGIEKEPAYFDIINKRLLEVKSSLDTFAEEA